MGDKISSKMEKKDKLFLIILTLAALFFSIGTHLTLINNSLMYYIFNKFTTVALFIFPVLSIVLIVFSCFFLFKKSKISFVIPIVASLVGCLLAFTLANDSFASKIESDFLKNEQAFNQVVNEHISSNTTDGTYEFDKKELNFLIPEKKIIIASVGNNKYAYFLVAIDIEDRLEGYVYDPYGSPEDWLENGEYSEPLDIEKKWSYFVYHKGVNYD